MLIEEFAEALAKDIRLSRETFAKSVCDGDCRNYDEYREHVGRMAALTAAAETVEEMAKQFGKDEDDNA